MNSSTADITPPILKKHSGLNRNRPEAIRRRLNCSCLITKAAHVLRGFLISFFTNLLHILFPGPLHRMLRSRMPVFFQTARLSAP